MFVMFCHVVSYSCVDFFFFFFFLRQTTLCMVCLKSPCVFILGGGLGFLGWGGFFVTLKKIWVCCHVQVYMYVQLYDALIFISMPA